MKTHKNTSLKHKRILQKIESSPWAQIIQVILILVTPFCINGLNIDTTLESMKLPNPKKRSRFGSGVFRGQRYLFIMTWLLVISGSLLLLWIAYTELFVK